jgi:hypothetical protein
MQNNTTICIPIIPYIILFFNNKFALYTFGAGFRLPAGAAMDCGETAVRNRRRKTAGGRSMRKGPEGIYEL